jgi:DNA-binding CsgD family transcriptional regulator/tetratricopeptide (TPR) repeat protein
LSPTDGSAAVIEYANVGVPAIMVDVPPDQPAAGPFIGRSDELTQLANLTGIDADSGAGSVLIAGDAGVGKTRLLSELRETAREAGWRTVVGHCLDFGDSALPYLPFSEAFGRLAVESPPLADALVNASPAVARLMPGRRVLSDVEQPVAERVERAELFDAIHRALDQLAVSSPLLLVVEDLHWADESTREMLSFLFARPFDGRVSVVASYRSDDLHRRHPLRPTVAEWSRLPNVSRIELRPLADPDVRTLVRSLHDGPLPERDLQTIVARAEGNAFFTEELVAATQHSIKALPTDLADLLLVRLDRLDDDTSRVVRAASVAGRRVSHQLLAHVVDIEAGALDRALRAAVEHNVLVAVRADSYAFRHALLAEAVYDDLLPGERVRLHGAYVTALQSHDIAGTAAELARHARAAHDLKTAVVASIAAGDEAMTVAGPDEAARHYELALELLADDSTGIATDQSIDMVDLAIKASDAAAAAGHPIRALALVHDQLNAHSADLPPLERVRLMHAVASVAGLSDNNVDALELTTAALKLVPAEPPTALRAQVLDIHARANAGRQRDQEAARWASEAVELGRRLGLPDVIANATTTLAKLEERAGDPESSQRALEKNIAEARAAGETAGEIRGLYFLGGLHFEHGHLDEAVEVYKTAAARAEELGRPWAPFGVDARALAGIVAFVRGDWDDVLRIVDVTGQSPPGLAESMLAAVGMSVSAGRGKQQALRLLPHLEKWWSKEAVIGVQAVGAAIDLYGDAGHIDEAIDIHDRVVASVSELWQEDFEARTRIGATLLGQLATEAARAGHADHAQLARLGDELVAASDRALARTKRLGRRRGPEGDAWVSRITAEHARLRWLTGIDAPNESDLIAAWERAVADFERFGHVFEVARSQARLAVVLRAVGRVDEARALAETARESARRLEAQPLLTELRTLAGPSRVGRRSSTPVGEESLTPREQEILALVEQGRTNREIASQLYISAKTVSVHISNILSKLGAGGRTEAVALARRRGLLGG